MSSLTSSDPGLSAEVLRLRTQTDLTWDKEARVLRRFGLTEGMSVVDLGSGPGYTTEKIAALVPLGSVTAIDSDPLMVRQAEKYLGGARTSRITLLEASVMDTGLPDGQFDFAIARFLFQHLADPLGAMREVFRILKPGGRLVISDSDEDHFYLADPPLTEYQRVLEMFRQVQASRRGEIKSRRAAFMPLLKQAGFLHLDLEAVLAHSEEVDSEELLTALAPAHLLDAVTRAGLLTPSEAEAAARGIEDFFRSGESFFALILLMAYGEKPRP